MLGAAASAWALLNIHRCRVASLERKYGGIVAAEAASEPELLRAVLAELPAWVRSGRYERTDWLSGALQSLWPSLAPGLGRQLQWQLEPALTAVAPSFVTRVRCEELVLGAAAPRITGALCADDMGRGNAEDGVEMELEVRWACEGHARLSFGLRTGQRLSFGVHDLTVSGLLRVRLAPLCAQPPGFAAVALCFAEQPTVRYRLSGVGSVVHALPGFSAYLQRCLADALCAYCVWPRRALLPLPEWLVGREPAATVQQLGSPACGVLRVRLMEAQELSRAELLGLRDVPLPQAGTSAVSPFVELELAAPPGGSRAGPQREASGVRRGAGAAPRWDETFLFVVDDPSTQSLACIVRSYDAASAEGVTSHGIMGEASLPLSSLLPGQELDEFVPLSLVVPKSMTVQGVMATYRVPSFGGELMEAPAGRLRLQLLYTPFSAGAVHGTWSSGAQEEEHEEEEQEGELSDEDEDEDYESDELSEANSEEDEEAAEERRQLRRDARRRARRHSRRGRSVRGVLFVHVERGMDLCAAHGVPRACDAYVTVSLAGERRREVYKTRVAPAQRTLVHIWSADFSLFVDDARRAELLLCAYDFSGMEMHVPLGTLRLSVMDIIAEQVS